MAIANSTRSNGLVAAVSYIRMSSDKQSESPDQQRKAIAEYAEQHGYRIVAEYFDDGISGDATEKRYAFQRMIADASNGTFTHILCWNQDRFGRFDSMEAGHWTYPLRQADVKLVTLDQGEIDWSDFAGRIVYSVVQEGKNAFLRDISRNSLRGKMACAKRGEWLSKPPYGYALENKRLVLGDTEEVATVKRIFNEYHSGQSLRSVAIGLNDDRISTRSGSTWTGCTIRGVLKRPVYTGTFLWNVSST